MSEDVSVGLVGALVNNLQGAPDDWESFSIVLGFDDTQVNSARGIAYTAESATPVSASPDIAPAVKAYTDSYYSEGQKLPVHILVQFDRNLGAYGVQFEDSDTERFGLTPENYETKLVELRPNFD